MEQLAIDPSLIAEIIANTPLPPDTSHLITEDDTPVDNRYSEKNQRLLTSPLHDAVPPLFGERPFVAAANVGVFNTIRQPAIVPDVFLSLDAEMAEDWWETAGRSYLIWEAGKPPDVVIEIVSNTVGDELGEKLERYARMRVIYYVVLDPNLQIQDEMLTIYELRGGEYVERTDRFLPEVGLGLTLWAGEFEGKQANWLRWCDRDGNLIPTGQERAEEEHQRADEEHQRADEAQQRMREERQRADEAQQQSEQERQRAEEERQRAAQERARAERLVAQLRLLGIEPEG